MQGAFEAIFPRVVTNEYRGSRIAFYGYLLLMAQQAFSGIVHYFTYDSGKVQIAGMIPFEGDPNPNALIFAFGAASRSSAHAAVVRVPLERDDRDFWPTFHQLGGEM